MIAVLLAALAGGGAALLYSGAVAGHRGFRPHRVANRAGTRAALDEWLVQAGLAEVKPAEVAAAMVVLGLGVAATGFLLVGPVPAVVMGIVAALTPLRHYRNRRNSRHATAQEAWPRIIEEIRIRTLSLGRSVPQALFEAGHNVPSELRPAFDAAHREWLLSVDFARTIDVLKANLADPTADAACETLLIPHEVGGADLADRLEALAADRREDAAARKDARAKQAGVRFARRFVLAVPAGMAVAGSMIGNGRAAYTTGLGQLIVLAALALTGLCWIWAGHYLRMPVAERVFRPGEGDRPAVQAAAQAVAVR